MWWLFLAGLRPRVPFTFGFGVFFFFDLCKGRGGR